jgi:phosphatidylglycerol:prolipoprotein diacylglycerol transferase
VCKLYRLSIPTLCDLGACVAPVGIFLVRCANFVNGELWGKETDLPWGVMFETGGQVYRHPSQLYEALLEGLIMFVLLWALARKVPARSQGTFMGTFLLWYGLCRILVEFVRVPDSQLGYLLGGVVTMGQILSLPLVVGGIALLIWSHKAARPQVGHVA